MKKYFYLFVCLLICSVAIAQENVGIGLNLPLSKLHIHGVQGVNTFNGLQITTTSTGSTSGDGLLIQTATNAAVNILNQENAILSLGNSGSPSFYILNGGDISINRIGILGSSDLTLRSLNNGGYGGMYIESINSSTGQPFYGYALANSPVAWHYYNASTNDWRLSVGIGDRLIVGNDGRVHIGTAQKLVFNPAGQSAGGTIEMRDNDGTLTMHLRANENTSEGSDLLMYNEAGILSVQLDADVGGAGSGTLELYNSTGTRMVELDAAESSTDGAQLRMWDAGGNQTVELDADWSTQGGGYLALEDAASNNRIRMYATEVAGQGASVHLLNQINQTTIELDADFNGDGRVITDELEIKGGSDLAEYFDIAEGGELIEPGKVVSIDPDTKGGLKITYEARDRKVAGVISGANGIKPGMMMGQHGSIAHGVHPVAVAGRVYVRVDESAGKIKPGDFLTSSSKPGHARRVRNFRKAQGAILGKALTTADENDFVLLLVHLQ